MAAVSDTERDHPKPRGPDGPNPAGAQSLGSRAGEPDPGSDRPHRRLLGHLRDRVAASDPAYSRLRMACRAMLTLLVCILVLGGFSYFVRPLPIISYALSFMLSFTGSVGIREKGMWEQMLTRLYAWPVVTACVFASSLLSARPALADLAFLAVIFAAVYIRKFGMRWFSVGMMAFMSFFMGEYLKPQPSEIGWIAFTIAVALAASFIVTNILLPSDEERDFRRALTTIDRRINLILRQIRHCAQEGRVSAADNKAIRSHTARLRDTMLMAEGFLPQGEEGSLAASGAASEVAIALFDLQLVVERLVRSRHYGLPPVRLIQAVLDHNERAVMRQARRFRDDGPDEEIPARLLVRLHRSRARLIASLGPSPSPAFAEGSAATPGPGASPPASPGIIPASLQTPIQITIACAVAMGVGLMISPVRWYWAVITAFIVFNNTRSRGDTAIRALQRSGGTFGGFLVGTGVATLLQGDPVTSGILIMVLLFFAFYSLQVSYSAMIFFITIALALIYGLMGMFTPEILALRLGETVVGALAGTAMAFLVFPKRTASGVAEALEAYFKALRALVEAAARRAQGERTESLLSLSRALDRKYADLATLVRPLGGPWNSVTRFGSVRERLLLLSGSAHWSRILAQYLSQASEIDPADQERIEATAERVKAQIDEAIAKRDAFFKRERRNRDEADLPPRRPTILAEKNQPVVAIEQLSALLEHAGARRREEPEPAGKAASAA